MNGRKLPPDLKRAIEAEQRRALEQMASLIVQWPQHRIDIAKALLAANIASTSIVKLDVDRFLVEVRQRDGHEWDGAVHGGPSGKGYQVSLTKRRDS